MEAWARWSSQAHQRMVVDEDDYEDDDEEEEEDEETRMEEDGMNTSSTSLSLSLRINRLGEKEEKQILKRVERTNSSSSNSSSNNDSNNNNKKRNNGIDFIEKSGTFDTAPKSNEEHSRGAVKMVVEDHLIPSSLTFSSSSQFSSSRLNECVDGRRDSVSPSLRGGWYPVETNYDLITCTATTTAVDGNSMKNNNSSSNSNNNSNNDSNCDSNSNDYDNNGEGMKDRKNACANIHSLTQIIPKNNGTRTEGELRTENGNENGIIRELREDNLNMKILSGTQDQKPDLNGQSLSSSLTGVITSSYSLPSSTSNSISTSTSSVSDEFDRLHSSATATTIISSKPSITSTSISDSSETNIVPVANDNTSSTSLPNDLGLKTFHGISMKNILKKSKKRPTPSGFGGLFGSEY